MPLIDLLDRVGNVLGSARGDRSTGGLLTAPSAAAFDAAVERGNVWAVANQTTVTTQAGLSVTTPALTIANRINSGKSVRIWYCACGSLVAAGAAAAIWPTVGQSPTKVTETTAATGILNMKTGDTTAPPGVACLAVATLPVTPIAIGIMGVQTTAAITVNPSGSFYERWYNGALRLAPTTYFSIQTSTASTLFCEVIFEVTDL